MNQTFARSVVTILGAALSVAGCATASKDLASTYVSPNQYANYDCGQLTAESTRIQTRVIQLGGRLDQAAQNDVGIAIVGAILFWPALFALGGTKQQEAEYSRLKGEYEAVEQASIAKKCAPGATPTTQTTAATSSQVPAGVSATVVAPTASASAPSASPAVKPAVFVASVPNGAGAKYQIDAEQLAKDRNCDAPVATLGLTSASYETFNIACARGDALVVRCDSGSCRELR